MAFTATKVGESVWGNKRVTWGTLLSDSGSTGGDINTGLHVCEGMFLTAKGSSVVADALTVNETFPVAGSAVTIVTTANAAGYWYAFGD